MWPTLPPDLWAPKAASVSGTGKEWRAVILCVVAAVTTHTSKNLWSVAIVSFSGAAM